MSFRINARKIAATAALLLLAAGGALAARRAGPAGVPTLAPPLAPSVERLAGGTVLWVGAHPDDELFVSPLLGEICARRRTACTLWVLTRGGAGECRLATGCRPDLAAIRTREMGRAAALLGADLRLWSLPDGSAAEPGAVVERWEAELGRRELSRRLAAVLAAVKPRAVITFDPRHGSTCHADHRAAGELIRRHLAGMTDAPDLYYVETRLAGNPASGAFHFAPAVAVDPDRYVFDARATWSFLLGDAGAHASQFDAPRRRGLEGMPAAERRVTLLPNPDAQVGTDERYEHLCGD